MSSPHAGGPVTGEQVEDDVALLDRMMRDMETAPAAYQPTNYWKNYEGKLLPYLRTHGLRDMRRPAPSFGSGVLFSFGAVDPIPSRGTPTPKGSRLLYNRATRRIPGWRGVLERSGARIERALTKGVSEDSLRRLSYAFVRAEGQAAGAVPLEDLSFSMVGNPEDAFSIDGRSYTRFMFRYYLAYAYACRFFDFGTLGTYAELGSGGGKQAEVIAKVAPDATILLFDLPPQLYVCNQYLTAVFGDRVAGYDEAMALEDLGDATPGRIYILPPWRFERLSTVPVDLFWNGASFQEMEPDVVLNYLETVERCAQNVFLQELMTGKERARKPGAQGVLEPTTLAHYEQGLPSFERVDLRPMLMPDATVKGGDRHYSDSFWRRRPAV